MKKFISIAFLLILLDQLTKFYIPGPTNSGGAFGILQGWQMLFIVVGLVVLGVIFYLKDKVKEYGSYGLILLFAGVMGNLIDRVLFGYVRDFIDLKIWPVFNLADTYSTIGVAILIIYFWKRS